MKDYIGQDIVEGDIVIHTPYRGWPTKRKVLGTSGSRVTVAGQFAGLSWARSTVRIDPLRCVVVTKLLKEV